MTWEPLALIGALAALVAFGFLSGRAATKRAATAEAQRDQAQEENDAIKAGRDRGRSWRDLSADEQRRRMRERAERSRRG